MRGKLHMPLLSPIPGCEEGQVCSVPPTTTKEKPCASSVALLDSTQIDEDSAKSQKMDGSECAAKSPPWLLHSNLASVSNDLNVSCLYYLLHHKGFLSENRSTEICGKIFFSKSIVFDLVISSVVITEQNCKGSALKNTLSVGVELICESITATRGAPVSPLHASGYAHARPPHQKLGNIQGEISWVNCGHIYK